MARQFHPGGTPKIGGKDRKPGLSHPVEINLLAEIELVIAGNEGVEFHIVEEVNHVGTLVETRQQARRQRIASVNANEMTVLGERSGAFRLHHRRKARHAAASVLFLDPVNIVDQQKRNPRGGAVRTGRGHGNSRASGQDGS